MRIKITKEQVIRNDVAGKVRFNIEGDTGKCMYNLSLQDMKDLREELNKLEL